MPVLFPTRFQDELALCFKVAKVRIDDSQSLIIGVITRIRVSFSKVCFPVITCNTFDGFAVLHVTALRPFVLRNFFCRGCKQTDIFLRSNWFLSRKARKSSRLFSEWVWHSRRGAEISFSILESRSCENFGLAHFSNCAVRKLTVCNLNKESPAQETA